MLLFLCVEGEPGFATDPSESPHRSFRFSTTLDEAITECRALGESARVYAIDSNRVELASQHPPYSGTLLPGAALNLGPTGYLPPEAVGAAGGYVVRRAAAGVELLLIFRRGQWDLPKGKLDAGETPMEGAVREVAEEVGVPEESLEVLRPLGTTVHGYPHPRRATYGVKTTHWFAMIAKATTFTPQEEEDIELVEWVPWSEAGTRLRFESLRQHHAAVDPEALGL